MPRATPPMGWLQHPSASAWYWGEKFVPAIAVVAVVREERNVSRLESACCWRPGEGASGGMMDKRKSALAA